MKRIVLAFTLLAAGLLALQPTPSALEADAQPTLRGTLRSMIGGEPIAGAYIHGGGSGAESDADGGYALFLPAGEHALRIEATGYLTMTVAVTVTAEQPTLLDLELMSADPSPEEAAAIELLYAQQISTQEMFDPDETDETMAPLGLVPAMDTIRVLMPDESIVVMPLEEYLRGVVPSEMPPFWPMEALKAQAVAARSYAVSRAILRRHLTYDVCTTTATQVWQPLYYDRTDQAVAATRGEVAIYVGEHSSYHGRVIQAFYFARTGPNAAGECWTRNVEDVWSAALPYCRAVDDNPCEAAVYLGHGVGMPQWGARRLALADLTYKGILQHYYTDIELVHLPGSLGEPALFLPLVHRGEP